MTTPIFPSVIGHNLLDGGTDAQDGNNYPGPLLQDYAAAVVGAAGNRSQGVVFPAAHSAPRVSSGGTLIADWASCSDSLNNGALRAATSDGNGTTRCFDLVANASGSYVDITGFPSFSLSDTKNIVLWVFASAGTSMERPIRILMSTDPGGAFTKYFEVVCSFPTVGKWVPLCIPRGSWTANGGATWDATVTKIRFRTNDNSVTYNYPVLAGAETIRCGSMLRNAVARASVMWSFDDGHSSIIANAAALAAYGWAGTAYIYPRQLGYASRVTVEDLRTLKSQYGWVIGNHSNASPDDVAGNSLKNLGPIGRGIALSSYGTDVINVAANRAPAAQIISPIQIVSGTPPTGVSLNTTYYARNVTASSMSIYTDYDSANFDLSAGKVTFVTGASTAGTWNYAESATDSTAIRNDLEQAADAIRRMGFGDDGMHVALPQGAYDQYVVRALRNFGARTVRLANNYGGSGDAICRVPAGYYGRRNGTAEPNGAWATFPGVIDFDNSTSAQIIAFIDSLIDLGGTGHIYGHTTLDANKLATVGAYLKSKSGQIDVTIPTTWRDSVLS